MLNKNQFLQMLKEELKGLPEEEVQEILGDYQEHFDIGLSEGRSEKDIAMALGNPRVIAKELKANYFVNQASESFTLSHFFQALMATIGLGFFNLLFVLGPVLGLFGIIMGIGASGIALVFTGFYVLVMGVIHIQQLLLAIFLSLSFISAGLIITLLVYEGTRWLLKLIVGYLKWNLNIITNRRVQHENR